MYKLNCNDCHKYYIGKTGRTFGERYKDHRTSSRKNKTTISEFTEH